MEKYNVVFATDENYVQHLCVALTSLLKNNKDRSLIIYIINGGISSVSLKAIKSVTNKFQCQLVNITINDNLFSELVTNHHFTKANYYRLLIPNFIHVDKVLYMDADIVVNDSIDGLYNSDIGEYFIGAVEDPGFSRHIELKMNTNSRYFNSGIMLINLKKWRTANLTRRVIDFVGANPTAIKFVDQCGLNAIIDGNWKQLSLKYNQQAVIFENKFTDNYHCFTPEELCEAKTKPVVVHYTGSSKPWHLRNKHPYKFLYWKYLWMTPYKYSLPTDFTLLNMFKWMLPEFVKNYLRPIFGKK